MMRKLIHLIAVLFLAVPALAQVEDAQYLTIRLDNVPVTMDDAYVALDQKTWLPLERVSEDEWKGEFLLLSGLYDKVPQPDVRFLDLHGKEYLVSEGVDVQMTSSVHRLSDLEPILSKDVKLVVSGEIEKDTLVLEGADGTLEYPRFAGSTFTLPALRLGDIATVHALTEDGTKISYAFGRDVDLAELEETLEP